MSEIEFNEIFSKRLKYFMDKYDMTQADLAKRLGVGTTSVYNWVNGLKTPRMSKVDAMCEIFHCKRSDFMEESTGESSYYIDPETAKKAQELFDDPNFRVLFDAARDSRPEDLQKAADYLKAAKAMTLGLDNDEGC